jgi:hypothetical protein
MTKSESKFLKHPPTQEELEREWAPYAEELNTQTLRSLPIGTIIEYRVGQPASFIAQVVSQGPELTKLKPFFASDVLAIRDAEGCFNLNGLFPFAILKRGPQ